MVNILDILGTIIFAIYGAFRAVRYQLEIPGVLVLSIATGIGGGIIRDCMLDSTPLAAFQNEIYILFAESSLPSSFAVSINTNEKIKEKLKIWLI